MTVDPRWVRLVLFCVLACGAASLAGAGAPVNPGFEAGALGQVPEGWAALDSEHFGYRVELIDVAPYSGRSCAMIWSARAVPGRGGSGKIGQRFAAEPFRGQRVRFQAAVRTQLQPHAGAMLWLRVDRPDPEVGFLANMADRPIRSGQWREYEVMGNVAPDATFITLGMTLLGQGWAWIDDVAFEVVGPTGEGDEPPRALSERGLANLVALTRLIGYLRFFHPTDEAARTNWDSFAIAGVQAVEPATDPADLAARLTPLVEPIAPTVELFPTGSPPPTPPPGPAPEGATGYRVWYHRGFASSNPRSVFRSERLTIPRGEVDGAVAERAAKAPRPEEILTMDLGGGLSCRLPLAVHAGPDGTLPRPPPEAEPPPPGKPPSFVPNGNDRATRLAAVALGWNVFQHFYPYFDVVPGDWHQSLRRTLREAAVDGDAEAFAHTLGRLLADLHDGQAGVQLGTGSRVQLPLAWEWVENQLVVTRVVAVEAAAGVRVGDLVERIDGQPVAAVVAAVEAHLSGATPQRRRRKALAALLVEGRPEVTLVIRSPSGEPRTTTLARATPRWGVGSMSPDDQPAVAELRPGVYYLDLRRLDDRAFAQSLPKLQQAAAMVFDLRDFPQLSPIVLAHLIDEPVATPPWQVPIVTRPDRRDMELEVRPSLIPPRAPRLRGRAAFLINGQTIGYGETWLAIIEHYRLGELVGSPSAGTNGTVNPFPLPGGYRVIWTGMRVLKHDGSQHHGVGVRPTVPAEPTIAGIAAGRDEVLERALEVVSAGDP